MVSSSTRLATRGSSAAADRTVAAQPSPRGVTATTAAAASSRTSPAAAAHSKATHGIPSQPIAGQWCVIADITAAPARQPSSAAQGTARRRYQRRTVSAYGVGTSPDTRPASGPVNTASRNRQPASAITA